MSYNSKELLNAIIAGSRDGYIASNEYGKITFVNEVIERITGWSAVELIGLETSKLYALPESLKTKSLTGGNSVKPQAAILYRRDGKKVTIPACQVEIKKSSLTSDNDTSNDNLKETFAGYLTIFHPENPNNTNVDRAHLEFVSTVSHELRTPLTSIKGFAETLLKTQGKISTENQKKYIKIIEDQADRLTRLVEDLLAVSRLESHSQQLTIRALDLKKVINNICESLTAKANEHKIVQNIEKDIPDVWADADRLEQILTNLIDNAIKYSPKGTTITIGVSSITITNANANAQNIRDKIKIEVTDHGIGIKENDLPKIFTKFGRLDNPLSRQSEGTGLGLFITKSLVLALKGEISVNSKPGETTFTVILPAVIPSKGILLGGNENRT